MKAVILWVTFRTSGRLAYAVVKCYDCLLLRIDGYEFGIKRLFN
jgi:hypothetical protein